MRNRIILIICLLTLPLCAEVYRIIPGYTAFFDSLTKAHRTMMSINGRQGSMEVLITESKASEATRRLQGVIADGDNVELRSGINLSVIRHAPQSQPARHYVISDLPDLEKTIIFKNTHSSIRRNRSDTPEHRMRIAAPYPGSTPLFHAHDHDAAMELQISESPDPTLLIMQHYDQELRSDGWAPPFPIENMNSVPPVLYYTRGRSGLMCVSTQRDSSRSVSTITLLHKTLSVR